MPHDGVMEEDFNWISNYRKSAERERKERKAELTAVNSIVWETSMMRQKNS